MFQPGIRTLRFNLALQLSEFNSRRTTRGSFSGNMPVYISGERSRIPAFPMIPLLKVYQLHLKWKTLDTEITLYTKFRHGYAHCLSLRHHDDPAIFGPCLALVCQTHSLSSATY